ncbi:MAG: DNA-processing protein DprA [Betaproteobacteria bacterium]
MDSDELAAWLRLILTPGLGRAQARRLLAAAGSPQAALELGGDALEALGDSAAASRQLPVNWPEALHTTQAWLDGGADRFVFALGDDGYPPALLDTDDPPLLLFAMGTQARRWAEGEHETERWLAMVGSRNPTPQGLLHARQFAQALAQQGVGIVSGLALGIDGASHEGALAAGGSTVAVVGTGLDRVYPRRHLELARRIVGSGAIVSEFALGTPPLAHHFPQRNRILAGLAGATLVVEANLQSGSLITARLAAEQGKEVMAIPGSIDSLQSRGCHQLIIEGARLVTGVQDVLEELGLAAPVDSAVQTAPVGQPRASSQASDSVNAEDAQLLRALGFEPMGFDALQACSGLPTERLLARLLELELDGQLARLPGGLFQRLVRA